MDMFVVLVYLLLLNLSGLDCEDLEGQGSIERVNQQFRYQLLLSDFWSWRLSDVPEFATTVGVHQYDNKLEKFTTEACKEKQTKCEGFIKKLDKIDISYLNKEEVDNQKLLKHQLKTMVEGFSYRKYGLYNPINHLEGVYKDTSLWLDVMQFNSQQDYQIYKTRLRALTKQIIEQIGLMKEAIKSRTTLHRVSIESVPIDIQSLLDTPVKETDFYKPYSNQTMELLSIEKSQRHAIQEEGLTVLQKNVMPNFKKLRKFILNEYLPQTRRSVSISSLSDGFEYYCSTIQWYLSELVSPFRLFSMGKEAIIQLMGRLDHVKVSVGYTGRLQEFLRYIQGASKVFFTSQEEIVLEYTSIVKDQIPKGLATLFRNITLPNFVVQAMPFDGPEAVMMPGSDQLPGILFVNVKNPFKRPKWKMKAIALRETLPGRLYQATVELNLTLPLFRRYKEYRKLYSIPFQYPFHNAYTEGWSLYAESLGYEMNLFDNPYDQLGQLFSELYHLALMVTDTGIHAMSWSRDYAIQYLHKLTGISSLQAEQQVDRIITLPGHACAPAYGYIKIKQLKEKAQERFDSYFNIKDFHDAVLRTGPVPLSYLEEKINSWIDEEAPEYKPVTSDCDSLRNNVILIILVLLLLLRHLNIH